MRKAVLFLALLAIFAAGCGGRTTLPTGVTVPTLAPIAEPSPLPTATLPPAPTSTPDTSAVPVPEYPTAGTVMDNGRDDEMESMNWFFDWTDVPGAEEYQLMVIHSGATQPVILEKVSHSSYNYEGFGGATSALNDWTWRVRARVGSEWGPWTEMGVFDVEEMGLDPQFPVEHICETAQLPVDRNGPVEPLTIGIPDGLTIHEYLLAEDSTLDWVDFEPAGATREEVLALHDANRGEVIVPYTINDRQSGKTYDLGLYPSVPFRGVDLTATEYRRYDGTFHRVLGKVMQGETVLLEVPEEPAALDHMFRALDSTETDWFVEVGHQVALEVGEGYQFCILGDVVQNGDSLSARYGYREAFGFQLLDGKPFYFINQDGHLGISYDGQVSWLGFDEIPRYAEEYGGAVSPTQQWENAAAFFARRGDNWYYVEIGTAP